MSNDLLMRLQNATTDEERDWLVMEFSLAALPEQLQQAVWAAAIPHWFDHAMLNTLLADDHAPLDTTAYAALLDLSYVEPFLDYGHNLHERTRRLLLHRLWQDDAPRYRRLSQRAADWCAAQISQTGEARLVAWQIEESYHLLVADPERGADQLRFLGWAWQNPPRFAYAQVEQLARTAGEHGARLTARGQGWVTFWQAHLDKIDSRNLVAKERLLALTAALPPTDLALQADTIQALGDVHRLLAEYAAARGRYEEALPLYRTIGDRVGEANCIKGLGDVHRLLAEYAAARGRYEEALPLYRTIGDRVGEANCIQALGDLYVRLAEYVAAQGRYEEALLLYRTIGARMGEASCIKGLGDVHLVLSEYVAARGRYEEALLLYRTIGARIGEANCIKALGDVHRLLAEYAAAQGRYEEALLLYRTIGSRMGETNTLTGLAEIALALAQWDETIALYQAVLAYELATGLRNNAAFSYRSLGHAAKGKGDLAAAHDYYQSALDIFTAIGSPTARTVEAELQALDQRQQ